MTGPLAGSPAQNTNANLFTEALAIGFPVLRDASQVTLDPAAVRMLSDDDAIGIALIGDVLEVLISTIPSPSRLRDIANHAGMLVTARVTTPDVLAAVRTQVAPLGVQALAIGPALDEAVRLGASDLHLAVGTPPIVRVHGTLQPLERWPALSVKDLADAAHWVAGDLGEFTGDLDRSVSYNDRRWRVSLYQQRNALAMALRLLPTRPPRADELGLPAPVLNLTNLSSGLILFCGPTGSGKSTSMAALIDRVNETRPCHILTIEDPVEYLHPNRRAIVHQREVGTDTKDFAAGLRAALRQDPDVILVGELRDLETMTTALAAAETGHLVLATVHSNSAVSAVTRIVSSFPAGEQAQVRQQLAGALQAVIFQLLLPATRGGRVLAPEVLVMNTAARNIVRDDRLHELASLLDTSGSDAGMVSINRTLARLVSAGRVTSTIAEEHVTDHSLYRQFLTERPQHDLVALDPLQDLPSFGGNA